MAVGNHPMRKGGGVKAAAIFWRQIYVELQAEALPPKKKLRLKKS